MVNTVEKQGKVVVISGPSGVGKSTICHRLCDMLPAEFSVSVTTRQPRPGEKDERDYRYVTPEEFTELRDGGRLVEWAKVYGNLYGTSLDVIEEALANGRTIILEIDIEGCLQVREKIPEAMTFFLLPPSADEQERRIVGRATDAAAVIERRLAKADGEIRYASEVGCFDVFIVNDNLDETVDSIYNTIVKNTIIKA